MQYGIKHHLEVNAQAAGAVIYNEKKEILLVLELMGPKKGLWHIPSGSVENDELPQEAAIREIEEETGLIYPLNNYLNTYVGRFDDGKLVLRHVWLVKYCGKQMINPKFTKEVGKAEFFTRQKIKNLYQNKKLRMHHTFLMIEDAFKFINKLNT